VQVVAHPRELATSAAGYARKKIAHLARYAPRPVLFARVKLERMADPAVERPAVAEATLEVSGHPLRAHAAAGQLEEAVDLLEDRLRQQLEHLSSQASDGACVGHLVTQGEVVGKEQALLLSSRKKVEVGWRTRWGTHTGYLVEPAAVWKVQRPARLLDQRDPFLSPRSSSDSSTGSNHRSSTSRSASYLIRETQIAGDVLDVCTAGDFVGGGCQAMRIGEEGSQRRRAPRRSQGFRP